jgi:transposase-like protein
MFQQFNSLIQLLDYFRNEQICKDYLTKQLHGNTDRFNLNVHSLTCPHCEQYGIVYATKRGYQCRYKDCGKKFTILTKTIFENTKIPLRTWFAAIYLITAHKKGISSHQLARDLNITQRTAWFMLHRIREMFKIEAPEALKGIVEADETYVGGKNKNRHKSKKVSGAQGRGGSKDKTPVVGLAERDGKVLTFVVPDTDQVTLHTIVTSNVDLGSTLITDAHHSYHGLDEYYNHVVVKHGIGEKKYVTEGEHHTNTIEGYWTLIKRGYIGVYHYMSSKHLQRYCDEFAYRYNSRKDQDCYRFESAVGITNRARITYKQLIGDGKKKQLDNG